MKVLLQVRDVAKRYGSQTVLEDATAAFGEGMKVGVLGRNGAGKSTLLRILAGEEEEDAGEVIRARDLRLGVLEQHDSWEPGETVMAFLERRTGREEWHCGKAAARFALKDLVDRPVDSLPGGFRTRVKLAALAAADPEMLLLDEPTNFLDLATLLLLERFLADFQGGALVVSHDREFLKRTCDHTLEVERGRLTLFPGDVEEFLAFREEREEWARRSNAAVTAKKEQLQKFIDRFGAKNTKATQAKSKAKEMARLGTIKIEHSLPTARIRIPGAEERKGIAFDLEDVDIGYADRLVAKGIRLSIERGARVAIVGDNGQGKTTLLRTIAGELAPRRGRVKRGHGVEMSVYAQHVYSSLDPRDTVLTHLEKDAPFGQTRQDTLAMAGAFLFHDEEVHKPVSVLSGGERSRLCLAGLLLRRRPALLLDEPTNHLDFETAEALADALARFRGTVIFISHDRTFVSRVATEVLEVDGGHVRRRAGDYGEYVEDLDRRVRALLEGPATPAAGGKRPAQGAAAWAESKRRRADLARARKDLQTAEERQTELGEERRALLAGMQSNPASSEAYRRLHEVDIELEAAEEAWLDAQDRIERFTASA